MTKVKLPHRGRTGVVEIECATKTARIPVGPFRFVNGSRKGQFVPVKHIRKNFAVLVEELAKAR